MKSDISNNPVSIKADFSRVLKDFSDYLLCLQQTGNTFLEISESSKALMENWGIKSQKKQSPFLFQGPETAKIFIIDSETGFLKGESGELFIKILNAMKLAPDAVFICNAEDAGSVHQKIKLMSPDTIITLGTKAAQCLLNMKIPLEQFRGKFHDYHGIRVMPTFHPSQLLKQPEYKRQVWEDMKLVMEVSGLKHGS
ncbi:MAG: uracil-DNA glycosylase [Proteobacteria bacterium]|nr:uracil-DNA glycosylase [Pseudomonadota bacterium]MBU1582589.1 uracil-DNA glycosylase [Pseudomonadota bacterium]MBU2455365.1 uracil-DNA glycosylase [Pseudomonadota bacterium]MBU2630206.1 uracil-DNA glycosylase [Pseudomonadota bacterium]